MKKLIQFLIVVSVISFLLYVLPYIIFSKVTEYKNIKVYSFDKLNDNIENVLKRTDLKLSGSEINNTELNHNIFICDSYKLYSFLAFINFGPGARHAAGFASFGNNIYIAMTDVSKDLCFLSSDATRKRELSGLIAHEAIHNIILDKLGLIGYLKLRFIDTWKNDGYAEYIAFDKEIDFKKEINNLNEKWDDQSPKLMYLKYRLAVTYLMNKKNLTFKNLINNNYDFDNILLEIKKLNN
jgi:hypothetical protein